ncbi:outer membrane beta-barrel protein [Arenimonas sp. MALMAid1274]|uniref:outer membrane beta-barrel protein n=1 Tax=Arenimonas sp. MALMAid1274 TaxID=3411630 RepID=UPI003B9E1F3C
MKRSLMVLALASLLPVAALAQDGPSYTWIEGDYLSTDGDGGLDADGFGLRGSYEFGQSGFYGFAGYHQTDIDNTSIDAEGHEVGLGYALGVSDRTDFIGELAHQRNDLEVAKIDGFRTSVGLRSAFSERFEGLIKANYYDGSDYSGDFTGTVGAQWRFTDTWGITGEAEFGDGGESYLAGLRATF